MDTNRNAARDEFIVKRLETFGDIVIGFSLAELSLNLVVPQHIRDFYQHPAGLVAFVATFAIIAQMWWNYTTLFRYFFLPKRWTIGANFLLLCGIVLLVFVFQMLLHQHSASMSDLSSDTAYAFNGYFVIFSIVSYLMGALYLYGLVTRWSHLSNRVRTIGLRRSVFSICLPTGIAIALAYELLTRSATIQLQSGPDAVLFPTGFVGLFAGLIASRIIREIASAKLGLNEPEPEPAA